ncbi:unnamed protein product [Cercospora beticola]|nr:unnamed protein product [Cercospora beticola]
MLKDDFSGLVDTAAEGEFIRIIAELYEYVSSDNRREWEFSPGLADTPFAGYAMQLGNKSGIKVVYIRQGLLSSRLGPFVPDGLTEVVRQIYHKAMRHRVTSPDLYDGTVLLSEAEDLAGALYQHTLGPSSGTACQPCLDSEAIALSGRCRVVGCSRSFPSADRMLRGDKVNVKSIPEFAIDAVQSAYVGKQLELPFGRPTEPRSAATLAMLCDQIDYQAQAFNPDILLAMGHWTVSAQIEQSLTPLHNSGGVTPGGITRRDWESAIHAVIPRENWPEDAAFGSFSRVDISTQELRFIVRGKMVSIARKQGMLWSVIIDSTYNSNWTLYSRREARVYDALIHSHFTMPFTNPFADVGTETIEFLQNSSKQGRIQALGCAMRCSRQIYPDSTAQIFKEENLLTIDRFEYEQNWVELSPVKVTAERMRKRGVESISFMPVERQTSGDRRFMENMNNLRSAHPRNGPIHPNLIIKGPDGLTATQDLFRTWALFWETQYIFVTIYVLQKRVSPELMANPFFRYFIRWNGRMDGYFFGPIANAASAAARDPNSPQFDAKVRDFWDLNHTLAQGKQNMGGRADHEDLVKAWLMNRQRNAA